MIRVRDDDVLVPSSGHPNQEESRFIKVHEMIVRWDAHHVPAILCGEIQKFPDTIEYIKDEIGKGTMTPELHGWLHSPYHEMTPEEVDVDLGRCVEWFSATFGQRPSIWYTPWGADCDFLYTASTKHGMKLVDCSKVISPRVIQQSPEQYRGTEELELFIHWWEGMGRLDDALRIING